MVNGIVVQGSNILPYLCIILYINYEDVIMF